MIIKLRGLNSNFSFFDQIIKRNLLEKILFKKKNLKISQFIQKSYQSYKLKEFYKFANKERKSQFFGI